MSVKYLSSIEVPRKCRWFRGINTRASRRIPFLPAEARRVATKLMPLMAQPTVQRAVATAESRHEMRDMQQHESRDMHEVSTSIILENSSRNSPCTPVQASLMGQKSGSTTQRVHGAKRSPSTSYPGAYLDCTCVMSRMQHHNGSKTGPDVDEHELCVKAPSQIRGQREHIQSGAEKWRATHSSTEMFALNIPFFQDLP